MRILLLIHEPLALSDRSYTFAKYWTIAGHEVTIHCLEAQPKLHLPNPGFTFSEPSGSYDLLVTRGITPLKWGKKMRANKWIADVDPADFGPFSYFDKRLVKQADLITTPLLSPKLSGPNVYQIEEGFEPVREESISKDPLFVDDGKFRLVHTGPIHNQEELAPLFATIKKLQKDTFLKYLLKGLEVVFVGDSAQDAEVEPWVKNIACANRGKQLRAQRDSHWLLHLSQKKRELNQTLYEYLHTHNPILTLPSEQNLEQFLTDKLANIRHETSPRDSRFLQRYSRSRLAEKLLDLVK